ncbi:MAG: FmdB family zinc ribbon protein [Anaerolineales bacterium]
MPIYEYRCPKCSAPTSVWYASVQRGQRSVVACEACGHRRMRRVLSTFALSRGRASASGQTPDVESPQALAREMRSAARASDPSPEFKEVAARLEKGESAGAIETSLRKRQRQKAAPH